MEPAPRTQLDDLQDLLEDNLEVARENNKLLKAMRRDALIGGIVKTALWVLVLLASLYFSYMFLEPLLAPFAGMDGSQFQALFQLYTGQFGQ